MPRVPLPKKRTLREELASLEKLLGLITPVPEEWLSTNKEPEQANLTYCTSYRKLVTGWRKALKWTDGLDCSLSVMLAASASTCLVSSGVLACSNACSALLIGVSIYPPIEYHHQHIPIRNPPILMIDSL